MGIKSFKWHSGWLQQSHNLPSVYQREKQNYQDKRDWIFLRL